MNSYLAVVCVGLSLTTSHFIHADSPVFQANDPELKNRLKAGLRTRLPEEEQFLDDVVLLVRNGKLPGKLVDSIYLWAIGRRKEYPFPAFEKALKIQAKKIGLRL